MAKLVDNDEQIEKNQDLENDQDDARYVEDHVEDVNRDSRIVIRVWRSPFRCNVLTIQRFNVPPCFLPRPLVGPQYLIEIGMRNGLVRVHHLLNRLPDSGETHPFFEKS